MLKHLAKYDQDNVAGAAFVMIIIFGFISLQMMRFIVNGVQ